MYITSSVQSDSYKQFGFLDIKPLVMQVEVSVGKCFVLCVCVLDVCSYQRASYLSLNLSVELNHLCCCSGLDAMTYLWDLRTGKCVIPLEGHLKGVLAVAFSPDS